MSEIRAIPTRYLDALGLAGEYEPESFEFDGARDAALSERFGT